MTEEALQIEFRPQPRGIAVITSAPISEIADHGNYSAFQDLVDGYASSFARVHVLSPSGESPVKPDKSHRVTWHSGPGWLSPTNGLLWSIVSNRKALGDVELVRTFGPKAGVAGKVLSRITKSPLISSSDDLVGNEWREQTGWRSTPTKLTSKLGMMRANMLAASLEWELEYLSDVGYKNDLLIGKAGLATDVFTTVSTTDPSRHPVVLWTGPVINDDSIMLIEESARATQRMIENVEFVVVSRGEEAGKLSEDAKERNLPITVASLDQSEPLVDLVERTWACITTPNRGIPSGLAMLTASAGIPLVSLGELDETHGFKNQLNYVGVEAENPESVAYGLQLLRRWSDWSLRIGAAGQRIVEERYSTKAVALREGEQLARIARGEQLESSSGPRLKHLKRYTSPSEGEIPSLFEDDEQESALDSVLEDSADEENDEDLSNGFDLVAAALEDVSNMGSQTVSTVSMLGDSPSEESSGDESGSGDLDQDAISALFASAEDSSESGDSDSDDGQLDQDAISALFESEAPDESMANDEPAESANEDLDQDAITALFESGDPETNSDEATGVMDQDAISALFDSDELAQGNDDSTDQVESDSSGDLGQDAITALFESAEDEVTLDTDTSAMDQDAISALFADQDSPTDDLDSESEELDKSPEEEVNLVEFGAIDLPDANSANLDWEPEPVEIVDQDEITALFSESDSEVEPDSVDLPVEFDDEQELDPFLEQAEEIEDDVVSAILDAKNEDPLPLVEVTDVEDSDVDLPSVNMIQMNDDVEVGIDEVELVDDFEVDDIDPDLIASILEGKDVDPSL